MLSDTSKIRVFGMTDVGLMREHNEDHIDWDAEQGLILLADGMGGHNAGEVASELAVRSIKDALRDVLTPEMHASNAILFTDAVREAISYANDEINRQSSERIECQGMGTTISMLLFHGDRMISAHVGDSRTYRLRNNELVQVTTDHSLVQEMVDNGYLSEEEAQQSASRNLITRALGIAEQVDVDVTEHEAKDGDIYMMCSDGLSDLATNEEIESVLLQFSNNEIGGYDMESAVKSLVALANEKGGKDNISVILVCKQEAFSDSKGIQE